MSRSYNKNYYGYILCCGDSQKKWKQSYNRLYRRESKIKIKETLKSIEYLDQDYSLTSVKKQSYADIWNSPSDGKIEIKLLDEAIFLELKEEYRTFITVPHDYIFWLSKDYEAYLGNFKRLYISK